MNLAEPTLRATLFFDVLLTLFYHLRERQFPLGPADFILALDALGAGFGDTSQDDFVFLCQSLWGKSPQQQQEIEDVLRDILRQHAGESTPETPQAEVVPPMKNIATAEQTPSRPAGIGTEAAAGTTSGATLSLHFGQAPLDATIPHLPVPAVRTPHFGITLDLAGSLPIRRRHMKRSWRYFRKMLRSGPPVELDIDATIAQISRFGRVVAPVLVPRRRNQAAIIYLVDEGGSMVPFRRVITAVLESAKQGGLSRTAVWYFHDVPKKRLYSDPARQHGTPLHQALQHARGASILIVSDAGAARRRLDPHRLAQTEQFINFLRRYSQNLAWLNPTPPERWRQTTAAAIRQQCAVPMFPVSRNGLDDAVDVLRGKSA